MYRTKREDYIGLLLKFSTKLELKCRVFDNSRKYFSAFICGNLCPGLGYRTIKHAKKNEKSELVG